MKAQHHSLSVAGQDLHVVEQGRGQPLLLVHGFPLDHSMWAGQLDELADSFRLLAPDLPGFGRSAAVAGMITMAQVADQLVAVLDQLHVDQPAAYCGLSMGGYVGWEFWNRHPDRLSHVIMCDTRAAADTPEVARGREMMAADVEREGAAQVAPTMLPKLFAPSTRDAQPAIVAATRAVIDSTAATTIAAYQRGMAERANFVGRLRQLERPTLFLCGADDVITPAAEMKQMATAVPGAQYVEVAAAGHMAPLEQPTIVNRTIREFLL